MTKIVTFGAILNPSAYSLLQHGSPKGLNCGSSPSSPIPGEQGGGHREGIPTRRVMDSRLQNDCSAQGRAPHHVSHAKGMPFAGRPTPARSLLANEGWTAPNLHRETWMHRA